MTAGEVVGRMRALDPGATIVHQKGSHQKWRLSGGCTVIVPVHSSGDVPIGTLASIQRQGAPCLGRAWLLSR